eukprot:11228033-Lingulodinium_polyedra.AAC.1
MGNSGVAAGRRVAQVLLALHVARGLVGPQEVLELRVGALKLPSGVSRLPKGLAADASNGQNFAGAPCA